VDLSYSFSFTAPLIPLHKIDSCSRKGAPRMKFKLGSLVLLMIVLITACSPRPNEANARDATSSTQSPMAMEENRTKNEAAIRELVDAFVKAIRAKDMNGVMAVFAHDVVSFDLGPPLEHGGGEAFMKRWQELFDAYQSPIEYEVRDLSITAGDDVAFSHSLNRISGTMTNGQKTHRWLRWTAGYRKTNGKWLIVHEQVSVPVDLRNRKAMLDLKP
jgi:uncharacterized protein (TIGR02246 family)